MRLGKYPPGWDEKKVRRVLKHHEQQTEEEAVNSQKGQVRFLLFQVAKDMVDFGRNGSGSNRNKKLG
jgi:hypothetical protein